MEDSISHFTLKEINNPGNRVIRNKLEVMMRDLDKDQSSIDDNFDTSFNDSDTKTDLTGFTGVFIKYNNTEPVGFVTYFIYEDEAKKAKGHIDELFVKKQHRGKGYATELIDAVEYRLENLVSVSIYVLYANKGAIKLYEKMGYVGYACNLVGECGDSKINLPPTTVVLEDKQLNSKMKGYVFSLVDKTTRFDIVDYDNGYFVCGLGEMYQTNKNKFFNYLSAIMGHRALQYSTIYMYAETLKVLNDTNISKYGVRPYAVIMEKIL